MNQPTRPVLIIGAGPTGLAVAKSFRDAGIEYEQVEARALVGGNWVDGVYESAHLISSKRTTEYTDFPMPEGYPDFPSSAQMRAYFRMYAEHFDLERHIAFETEVVSVVPVREPESAWDVTMRGVGHLAADGNRTKRYRGVVVCNGHHWAKTFPSWAGDFTGPQLHSKDYKEPEELRGKRVLVVGGGNSGCDIISEAARVAATADWSLRRGYWFVPKTIFGRPTIEMLKPWLPVAAQRLIMKAVLPIVVGRYEQYGLPRPEHELFEAHPSVSTEVFHYLKHGRIHPRPDVASAHGKTIRFVDGSEAEFDLLVLATGFDVSFPFLPEGLVPVVGKTPQLLGGVCLPDQRHLWIVGAYQARYGIGPLLTPLGNMMAKLVALQDEIAVPLGKVFASLGAKPPKTHLVDPHMAIRRMAIAERALPLLRWQAKRHGWLIPRAARTKAQPTVDGTSSRPAERIAV